MVRSLVLVFVCLLLSACGGPVAPTPDAVVNHAVIAQAVAATLTALAPTIPSASTPTAAPHTPTPTPTRAAAATLAPSLTPSVTPTPTLRPAEQALLEYLALFVPMANEIWASVTDPSDEVTPAQYASRVGTLCEELEAMAVPSDADEMHGAFEMLSNRVHVYHLNRALALMNPQSFEEYMVAADLAAQQMSDSSQEYLSARDALLARQQLSADRLGFEDQVYAVTPRATSTATRIPPPPTPRPTKAPTATPVRQLLADSLTDFSGGQGQNSWEFLFAARDSFNWRQMTFDGSCYISSEPRAGLCADQGAPGGKNDIAWLYKAEASGKLLFRVSAHKVEAQGDDIDIAVYRHLKRLYVWPLMQGDRQGFTNQFELDVDGGEMFFFMMHISSRGRAFKYDPNAFRVQVYLSQ